VHSLGSGQVDLLQKIGFSFILGCTLLVLVPSGAAQQIVGVLLTPADFRERRVRLTAVLSCWD